MLGVEPLAALCEQFGDDASSLLDFFPACEALH
jgi:hypothetical protein